jgi:hypothetical protein
MVLLPAVVGAGYVAWREPGLLLVITFIAAEAALGVCRLVGEYGWLFVFLALIFAVLGNALYALHLLGVSFDAIALVAALLVGLVFLILARAMIAAGSADYPYDD